MSKYHPRIFIPVEFTNSPIEEDFGRELSLFQGDAKCLFFCYFNNSSAFNEYLKCFKAKFVIVVGPKDNAGVHTDPMPMSPEFNENGDQWMYLDCRYLKDNLNVIAVYCRK